MLDDPFTPLSENDRIRRRWSLGVDIWDLMVAINLLGDVNRIVDSTLAVDDTVASVDSSAIYSSTSRTSSTSSSGTIGYGGVKAFATREGKEYCSQAQYQDENR